MTDKLIELGLAVDSGNLNPLDAYCELNRIEKLCSELKKQIQQQAVNEAQKHGKTFKHMGFEIQCKSSAGRWKFDHINDWVVAKMNMSIIEDNAKWAFKLSEKGSLPVNDGGEIVQPATYVPGADIISLKEIPNAE
jgi:hypothetical protein